MIPRAAASLLDDIRSGYPVITARHTRLICAGPDNYTRSGIEVRRWQEVAT